MKIELSEKEIQDLINYLSTKPWGEVVNIINPILVKVNQAKQKEVEEKQE